MAQQTAVKWLINWMSANQYFIGNDLLKAVQEGDEMEKQNIINAWWKGREYGLRDDDAKSGEQYYNETYKRQTS